jgi:hypothetical protein
VNLFSEKRGDHGPRQKKIRRSFVLRHRAADMSFTLARARFTDLCDDAAGH